MSFFRILLLTALAYTATPSLATGEHPASASEIQQIDDQISSLKADLKVLRRDAFNKEMHAQTFMFDNWHQYADLIKANATDERKIAEIKTKIKALKERKEAALKSSPQTTTK